MGDLAQLEVEQRRAALKAEQSASRRMVHFDPRQPLSGAALQEGERMDALLDELDREQEAERRWEAAELRKLDEMEAMTEAGQMARIIKGPEFAEQSRQLLDDVYGPQWRDEDPRALLAQAGPGGFSDDGRTYTPPATHMNVGPAVAQNIPQDLLAKDDNEQQTDNREPRTR